MTHETAETATWYSVQVCIDDEWVDDSSASFPNVTTAQHYLDNEELWGRATPWAHRIIRHTHITEVTK